MNRPSRASNGLLATACVKFPKLTLQVLQLDSDLTTGNSNPLLRNYSDINWDIPYNSFPSSFAWQNTRTKERHKKPVLYLIQLPSMQN